MKALVVDDSRAIRSILRKSLREVGVEVVAEAAHGVEALSRLRETGPLDLTLVDWNMPEMDGFDFLCAVRRERAYDAMRVVMVTTETEASQMGRALGAGANEYIMKPFTTEVLREKLALLGIER